MTGSNEALYSEAGDSPRASLVELAAAGMLSLDFEGDNGAGCNSSSCVGLLRPTGRLEGGIEVDTSDMEPYLPVCMAGSLGLGGLACVMVFEGLGDRIRPS